MKIVDLRSDTVTQPTPEMRLAMVEAPLGDDVFADDPSVNALQDKIASLLGFEAALFVPTGTQSNLCAILSHCQRGDEYIVGQQAHCYRWEGGGAAVFGSVQPQPLNHAPDGTLPLQDIEDAIKPDDAHFARTRLLALENTLGGRLMPMDYLRQATALAQARGLVRHLDGARLFNAAVAQAQALQPAAAGGQPAGYVHVMAEARAIAQCFDSVSVCFSKGLGRAGGFGAVRQPRDDCPRPPHSQDGGRWHAPGGHAGGGGVPCAGIPRGAAGARPCAGAPAGRRPAGHRRPAGGGAADQHRVCGPARRGAPAGPRR